METDYEEDEEEGNHDADYIETETASSISQTETHQFEGPGFHQIQTLDEFLGVNFVARLDVHHPLDSVGKH